MLSRSTLATCLVVGVLAGALGALWAESARTPRPTAVLHPDPSPTSAQVNVVPNLPTEVSRQQYASYAGMDVLAVRVGDGRRCLLVAHADGGGHAAARSAGCSTDAWHAEVTIASADPIGVSTAADGGSWWRFVLIGDTVEVFSGETGR